MTWAVV